MHLSRRRLLAPRFGAVATLRLHKLAAGTVAHRLTSCT